MENQIINTTKLAEKLAAKAEEHNWPFLNYFFHQIEFQAIIADLTHEHEKGHKFTPAFKDVFNAFFMCPSNDIKVIVIGQDPYPQAGVADGISFSCSKTQKEQPSLRYIFNAIEAEVYPDGGYVRDTDLSRWSKQGVIMMNTALTCRVGDIGSHYAIWKGFTAAFLEYVNKKHKDAVIVLLGNKADEWRPYIKDLHIIKVAHPASAAYSGGKWDSQNLFNKVNLRLQELGKVPIIW